MVVTGGEMVVTGEKTVVTGRQMVVTGEEMYSGEPHGLVERRWWLVVLLKRRLAVDL